ncbi:lipopolysaccharide biosynthesis protein [Vagococcus silagei]|uniref:Polysaccharide biosynthesis protein n=1 Tax=Vagococcus silagei TaxID=2508885 RepID=A0A4S3B1P1_9ENTE|nr:oligosaccharide flippase family protein [Vagococcus silagei]THB60157.1 polysaccharide biosynthesis protein [Vagococcus silagei]
MKKFIRSLLGFSIGPVIGALISLITIPLTTFFISPEEFGKSSVFSATYILLSGWIYLGMDQSYSREYNAVEDKNSSFFNAIAIPLLISFLFFLILLIFKEELSIWIVGYPGHPNIAILMGIGLIFIVFERFLLMQLRMEEKAVQYSLFTVMIKLISLIVLILLLIFFEKNFLVVIYSTIFGQILSDSYLIFKCRSQLNKFKWSILDINLIRKMLVFGLPLLLSVSLTNFLNTLGVFSLRKWSTFYDLGIFNAGQKISNMLLIIQVAFTSFWVPTAYRWIEEGKSIREFKFVSDILLLFITFGFYILLTFKNVFILILSPSYFDAKYILGFLVLIPIFYTLSETTTLGIVYSRKSYYNIFVSLISLLVGFLVTWFFVPLFGYKGAAFGVSIGYFLFYIFRTLFSKKLGFYFPIIKHVIVLLIFLVTALVNSINFGNIILINLSLFIISLIVQYQTFKDLWKIKKGELHYNLE